MEIILDLNLISFLNLPIDRFMRLINSDLWIFRSVNVF